MGLARDTERGLAIEDWFRKKKIELVLQFEAVREERRVLDQKRFLLRIIELIDSWRRTTNNEEKQTNKQRIIETKRSSNLVRFCVCDLIKKYMLIK